MEKSTHTIELLEEQLYKIEQMALQFSNDRDAIQDSINKEATSELNVNQNEVLLTQANGLVKNDVKTGNDSNFGKYEIENNETDIEEILDNISNKNQKLEDETKDASDYNYKILDMSKKGQSAFDIARTLGLGVGEVQLVIDLYMGGKR